jgi:hypothetical protein
VERFTFIYDWKLAVTTEAANSIQNAIKEPLEIKSLHKSKLRNPNPKNS